MRKRDGLKEGERQFKGIIYSTRQVRLRQRSPLSKETKPKVFPFSDKGHLKELHGDTEWACLYTLWERVTAMK